MNAPPVAAAPECPESLPNLCAASDCSQVLDDDGVAYSSCDGVCAPQEVCSAQANRTAAASCTEHSQCVSGSCAENAASCPAACIALPDRYCDGIDEAGCVALAQLKAACPAEFSACEQARPRCRPIPCEPTPCIPELASATALMFATAPAAAFAAEIAEVAACWDSFANGVIPESGR
jgi:hypothetical protein